MTPTTKTVLPLFLGAILTLHGCGDKDDSAGSPSEPEGTNPGECSDGADNDSDGSYDCDDSDCAGSPDCADPGGDGDGPSDTDTAEPVDADGDGYLSAVDCDDEDPGSTVLANDADCDGVLSCDDCDDDDSSMPVNDADCDGSPTDDDCDDNDPSVTICDPEFAVAWNASAVSLSIDGGRPGADYHWGIVETSNCADCWTGEDCFNGEDNPVHGFFNLCHPVGQTGGELTYDASYDAVEGESTLFSGPGFAANTTYIVDDRSDGGLCWIWGDDPAYYSAYPKTCIQL